MTDDIGAQLEELRATIEALTNYRANGPDWATVAVIRRQLMTVAAHLATAGRRDLAERLVGIEAGAGAPSGLDAAAVTADIADRVATLH